MTQIICENIDLLPELTVLPEEMHQKPNKSEQGAGLSAVGQLMSSLLNLPMAKKTTGKPFIRRL